MSEAMIEPILAKLDPVEQNQIKGLLHTIGMQAELIRELSRDLSDHQGAAALQRDLIEFSTLRTLADKMGSGTIQGPTTAELNSEIGAMRESIAQAESTEKAMNAIFGFAVKVAPMFLV